MLDISLGDFSVLFLGHTRRLSLIIRNFLLHSIISSKNLIFFPLPWYFGTIVAHIFGQNQSSYPVLLLSFSALTIISHHFSDISVYSVRNIDNFLDFWLIFTCKRHWKLHINVCSSGCSHVHIPLSHIISNNGNL